MDQPGTIRMVLLDIDGCLTAGEASPLSFKVLEHIQKLNQRAAEDAQLPAVTLCTGRSEPYVEFMCQAIGSYLPAIWENGAGLYLPAEYRFELHPLLDRTRLDALEQARRVIAAHLIRPGLAYHQPGKELSITLYPAEQSSLEEIFDLASQAVEALAKYYWVQRSVTTVEILPVGIHKGSGVRWLLERLEFPRSKTLGIGDSPSDVEIFRETELGATPSNAAPELRAVAHFVAPRPFGDGVLDILEWCVERNRSEA
jgi:HAD superfamily hydrolase (TIGR01484 family)